MPIFIHFFSTPLTISLSVFLSVSVSVQELETFKAFVKRKPAFHVVVDGLNVANINKDKNQLSDTVRKHTDAHTVHAKCDLTKRWNESS